jgi:hypothetical protein
MEYIGRQERNFRKKIDGAEKLFCVEECSLLDTELKSK